MLLYSTTGGKWTYPVRITYSIVPDGTSIGGTPSNLQQKLGSLPNWQQQIKKAAAIWETVTNINLVQVPDDGAPIGSSGDQQGDSDFGDIRIGGMAQSLGQLAFAFLPPAFNGGTNAGDIFFNTAQWWQTNGTTYDLLTVAIHEFGHALGMGHSQINTADMYASYHGADQSPTSDDVTGIQSTYGTPQPDGSNTSHNSALNITPYINGNGQIALANLDICTNVDVDWYKVTVPASTTGQMVVTMQSSGLSSLIPKVTVYNGNLQGAVVATGSNYGDTVSSHHFGRDPGADLVHQGDGRRLGSGEHRVVWPAGQLRLLPPGGHRAAFHGRGGSARPASLHNPGGNGVDDWRSIHPLPGHLECTPRPSQRRRWDLPHRLRHPLGLWRYDGGRQPGELWPPFPQGRGRHATPRASSASSSRHPPRFLRDHDHPNGRPQRCRPQPGEGRGDAPSIAMRDRGESKPRADGPSMPRSRAGGPTACSRGARRSPGDYPRRAGPPSRFPEVLTAIFRGIVR